MFFRRWNLKIENTCRIFSSVFSSPNWFNGSLWESTTLFQVSDSQTQTISSHIFSGVFGHVLDSQIPHPRLCHVPFTLYGQVVESHGHGTPNAEHKLLQYHTAQSLLNMKVLNKPPEAQKVSISNLWFWSFRQAVLNLPDIQVSPEKGGFWYVFGFKKIFSFSQLILLR